MCERRGTGGNTPRGVSPLAIPDLGDLAMCVLVVLDQCRDRIPAIVAEFGDVETVMTAARRVGVVRQIGVQAVLAAAGEANGLWLASTDADSQVPRTSLTQIVTEARLGADVVLGAI
jgi:hypothetical protein